MAIDATTTGWPWLKLLLAGGILVTAPIGCSSGRQSHKGGLATQAAPPATLDPDEKPSATLAQKAIGVSHAQFEQPGPTDAQPEPMEAAHIKMSESPSPDDTSGLGAEPVQTLTLPQAIEIAFHKQPRLRGYLETIEQARGGEDIAFAPYLPLAAASLSGGGYNLNASGTASLSPLPGFAFLPALGSIPFGLNVSTGYEFADLKLQWLILDFGRRSGRYAQAGLATEIAQLQTDRAYQTVANEVSLAYYQLLRTRALRKIALDAVRRSEDDLEVARKLEKGGALETEKRLRVEVQLSETRRLLDVAEGAEAVAVAALNLAIGLNINAPTAVVESADMPPFDQSLVQCLQTAISYRREFQVARQSIQISDEGRRVAKADFAPRILAEGLLFDFRQAESNGRADFALGAIKLEWGLFEGGRRVAELRIADSKIRAAIAQAETIADTVAFQVTEAYRNLITARRGIDRSQPAVAQAEENYRLLQARARLGDATSAEITDAQSALTRAQQDHLNSIHDYLIALARLEYAMGVTPTPGCY